MGTAAIAIPAFAQFLASTFAASAANKQNKAANDLNAQQIAVGAANSERGAALQESTLDPWRHSMFQADDIATLDRRERGTFTPSNISMPDRYAAYKPTVTGGFQYQKSPEYIQSMAGLKKLVMSGQGAPTQMNPLNYGKTGAINLLKVIGGADPTSSTATPDANQLVPDTNTVDGKIQQAYLQHLGRVPTPAEIQSQTGNGTFKLDDPRLQLSINNIANSPEARAYSARQLGAPGPNGAVSVTPTTPTPGIAQFNVDPNDPYAWLRTGGF